MPDTLAQKIRAKYPGAYDDIDDAALERQVLAKHPEYQDLATQEKPAAPAGRNVHPMETLVSGALNLVKSHPVETGAAVGGLAAAPFTGGMSLLPAMGLSGLATAGGAGYGMLAKGAMTGNFGTPQGNAQEMATQGALAAGGEGALRGVAALAPGLESKAVSAYERLLKPKESTIRGMTRMGQTPQEVSTAVAKNLLHDPQGQISAKGARAYAGQTQALQDEVKRIVAANPEARGSTSKLTDALAEGRKRWAEQWGPQADLAAYDAAAQDILKTPRIQKIKRANVTRTTSDPFDRFTQTTAAEPVGQTTIPRVTGAGAQKLTQGTYRTLGDRAYGELKGASTEAYKAGARGGRAILNEAIPAVEPINMNIAKRIDIGDVLEDAAFRSGKHNAVGLTDVLALGSHHPGLILGSLLNRPAVGYRAARGASKAADLMAQAGTPGISASALRAALLASLGGAVGGGDE